MSLLQKHMKPHCMHYILYLDVGYGTLCSIALSIDVVSARGSIYKEKNCGVCDSLNRALPFCKKYEFFAFLANDDLWYRDKLSKQIENFKKDNNIGMSYTEAKIINAKGEYTNQNFSSIYYNTDPRFNDNLTRQLFCPGNTICGASVVVTYDALRLFNFRIPLQVGFLTDWYMWLIISAYFKVDKIETPLTCYRVTESSVTFNLRPKLFEEAYWMLNKLYYQYDKIQDLITCKEFKTTLKEWAIRNVRESVRYGDYRNLLHFCGKALKNSYDLKDFCKMLKKIN